jgi:hypothetical protein
MLTLDDANPVCRINELWFAAKFISARLKQSLLFTFYRSFPLIEVGFDPSTSILAQQQRPDKRGIRLNAKGKLF